MGVRNAVNSALIYARSLLIVVKEVLTYNAAEEIRAPARTKRTHRNINWRKLECCAGEGLPLFFGSAATGPTASRDTWLTGCAWRFRLGGMCMRPEFVSGPLSRERVLVLRSDWIRVRDSTGFSSWNSVFTVRLRATVKNLSEQSRKTAEREKNRRERRIQSPPFVGRSPKPFSKPFGPKPGGANH